MKNTLKYAFAFLAVVLVTMPAAFASPAPVPEIDPATGSAALALLCGTVMVIRGRRGK